MLKLERTQNPFSLQPSFKGRRWRTQNQMRRRYTALTSDGSRRTRPAVAHLRRDTLPSVMV